MPARGLRARRRTTTWSARSPGPFRAPPDDPAARWRGAAGAAETCRASPPTLLRAERGAVLLASPKGRAGGDGWGILAVSPWPWRNVRRKDWRCGLARLPATHGPCPRDQRNRTVGGDRQRCAQAFPKRAAALLGQRHRIARRGALAVQERRPVVVEFAKRCCDLDGGRRDTVETGATPQCRQGSRLADRETPAFVQFERTRVLRGRRIPEVAHQFHFRGVIPHVGGHVAPGADDARHLGHGA